MAGKSATAKANNSDLIGIIDELQKKVNQQDSMISTLSDSLDMLGDDIIKLTQEIKKSQSVVGVSEIDPNLTFQKCLESAIVSVAGMHNIVKLSNNKSHLEQAVKSMVDLAEALQVELTERYGVEVDV